METERKLKNSDELESWKEIAAFIGRDERTAMRWAKERGMPVRRIPGGSRGRVYGSRTAIAVWLKKDELDAASEPADSPRPLRRGLVVLGLVGVCALVALAFLLRVRSRSDSVPTGVRFEADSVSALAADGRVLWTHRYPGTIDLHQVVIKKLSDLERVAKIADLRGDGGREVVVGAAIRTSPNRSDPAQVEVDCFSNSGKLLWSYVPHEGFQFGSNKVNGSWILMDLMISRKQNHSVYVLLTHGNWGNSFVAEIDPATGTGEFRFVNTGTLHALNELELPQRIYLLASGFNNEWDGGNLAVVDEQKPFAASPQTEGTRHKCVNCPPGDPDYYFVFPRSEVNRSTQVYENPVARIDASGREIDLYKWETFDLPNYPMLFYRLDWSDAGVDAISLRFDSGYDIKHRELEMAGKLRHSLTACPERVHPQPVRLWRPPGVWSEIQVTCTQ